MNKPIISIENLSKAYRLGLKEEVADTMAGAVANTLKAPFRNWRNLQSLDVKDGGASETDDILWALKDVSFDVHEGDVVGIIGRNGAGKSTLLKVLSRITEPTSGCVKLRGRVSSLLEVGTGFHPELSGRDNIYMNGTILGMTKREIDRKFDEIVDFSGVERFLDTPVKRYSSGMQVRLAFAVAAHLEPEILVIDEVLAVGDAEFQKKCLGKMHDVSQSGRTVLFVSHNMAAVSGLCTKGVYLNNGFQEKTGAIHDVMNAYLHPERNSSQGTVDLSQAADANSPTKHFLRISTFNADRMPGFEFRANDEIVLSVELGGLNHLKTPAVHFAIEDSNGYRVATLGTDLVGYELPAEQSELVLNCAISCLPLRAGRYHITVGLCDTSSSEWVETIQHAITIHVTTQAELGQRLKKGRFGPLLLPCEWSASSNNSDMC